MSLIGVLTTGSGIPTVINLSYTPQFIQVGEVDEDLPLSSISIQVEGRDAINIPSAALAIAFSKWQMESLLGADVKVAQIIKIATGRIGKNSLITLVNAGATTPNIYAYSLSRGQRILSVGTFQVNQDSNYTVKNFKGLFLDPTNLDYVELTFVDGTKRFREKFLEAELRTLFAMTNQGDANANLGTLVCIDNAAMRGRGVIDSATLFATGGNITVLRVS